MNEESLSSQAPGAQPSVANPNRSLHGGPLLVGVDWPAGSQDALRWAAGIAHDIGAKVILLHAISPWVGIEMAVTPYDYEAYRRHVGETVDEWAGTMGDVAHQKRIVEDKPAAAILHTAADIDPGLIVIGAHARGGWTPPVLGSVPTKVLHASQSPVALIPAASPMNNGPIVVGVDGSASSERALQWAATSAVTSGRELYAVCVFPAESYSQRPHFEVGGMGSEPGRTADSLRHLTDHVANESGVSISADLLIGTPVERLVEVGKDSFAIVLGKSGHGLLDQAIPGSTSRGVATHAGVPVILVP